MKFKFCEFILMALLTTLANTVIAANNNQAVIQNQNVSPGSQTSSSELTATQKAENSDKTSKDLPWLKIYRPVYIMPAYYTQTPYQAVYMGNTPFNQKVKSEEFKGQLSFIVPIWQYIDNKPLSLDVAYTQLSYWQFYVESQYFRETDYEPELFLNYKLDSNRQVAIGVDHQSNGRGGDLERSWNRAYINYQITAGNWMVSARPWLLIFQNESSDLHNRDIAHYLGYGWLIGAYKFHNQTVALMLRNEAESGFKRGAEELDWSIPVYSHFNLFIQLFSGYGQSLIEYNHYTNAIGVGVALNNWM